jgi:hypothetical protein
MAMLRRRISFRVAERYAALQNDSPISLIRMILILSLI